MRSNEVFDALQVLAATSGKNDKRSALAHYMEDADFARVVKAALDPFIVFNMGPTLKEPLNLHQAGTPTTNFDAATWSLINHLAERRVTGRLAAEAVEIEFRRLNERSAKLLWRILRKDLRAGFSEESVNKVKPGFIPVFPYMRCSALKNIKLGKLPWNSGIILQKKADGLFANLNFFSAENSEGAFGAGVAFVTRQGSPLPVDKFTELENEIRSYIKPGTQTHGELLIERNGVILPREQSNGIFNRIAEGGDFPPGHRPIYEAWDQIPLSAVRPKGTHKVPYKARLADLSSQIPPKETGTPLRLIPSAIVFDQAEMMAGYREYLAAGQEGAVGKRPDGVWKDGTSRDQWKLKLDVTVDLRLVGLRDGEGKNASTFGALICQTEDGLLEVGVAGMTDAVRKAIFDDRENLLGNAIVAVKANGIMKPKVGGDLYSLFLPRYGEIRKDKTRADTLLEVQDQFDSAVA